MALIVPAALVLERGAAITIEDVVVSPPGPGEVLVRLRAAGLCHTDLAASRDAPVFPVLLGHEAAGIVEQYGPGVTSPAIGTAVTLSWRAACEQCPNCRRGRQPWCEQPLATAAARVHRRDGTPVTPLLRTGAFCPYCVVPAAAAVPIPAGLPWASAALIGCGVATGMGAALFESTIAQGMDVAVFGLGGVGLNAVRGAAMAEAGSIVAVDRLPAKLELARRYGATASLMADDAVASRVREITDGRGVDVAFEAVGHPAVLAQALDALAPGGTLVMLGAPAWDALMPLSPRPTLLARQLTIRGSIYGGCRPHVHFPLIARWAMDGTIDIERMVSHTIYRLEDLADAFDAMQSGERVRTVLEFPDHS